LGGNEQLAQSADKLEKLLVTDEGKKALADIRGLDRQLHVQQERTIELRRAGREKDAKEALFSAQNDQIRADMRRQVEIKNIQDETKTAVGAMEEGTKQVQEGVKSTAQAGDSLKEIIRMSDQVGEMITHIATAATEQHPLRGTRLPVFQHSPQMRKTTWKPAAKQTLPFSTADTAIKA
jgi:hypothetical protein